MMNESQKLILRLKNHYGVDLLGLANELSMDPSLLYRKWSGENEFAAITIFFIKAFLDEVDNEYN